MPNNNNITTTKKLQILKIKIKAVMWWGEIKVFGLFRGQTHRREVFLHTEGYAAYVYRGGRTGCRITTVKLDNRAHSAP